MDKTTLTEARKHLSKARGQLDFAKQNPDFGCDVCGPDGQHTFHLCNVAAMESVKCLLVFHKQEPEQTFDIGPLVDAAVRHVKGFEECAQLIHGLSRCGTLDWRVPENAETLRRERGEALQLAERIVEFTASRLPEAD